MAKTTINIEPVIKVINCSARLGQYYAAREHGTRRKTCTIRASYYVDGQPYCAHHAMLHAWKLLVDQAKKRNPNKWK